MDKRDLKYLRRCGGDTSKSDRKHAARSEKLAGRRNAQREIQDPEGFRSLKLGKGFIS